MSLSRQGSFYKSSGTSSVLLTKPPRGYRVQFQTQTFKERNTDKCSENRENDQNGELVGPWRVSERNRMEGHTVFTDIKDDPAAQEGAPLFLVTARAKLRP